MGIRTRRVTQTITETICDFCKKPLGDGSGKHGTLAVKTPGAKGRPAETQVAFHDSCYSTLTQATSKRRPARRTAKKQGRPAKAASGNGTASTSGRKPRRSKPRRAKTPAKSA